MIYILFIPVIYILIKLILTLVFFIIGKFSYKDFNAFGFSYDDRKDFFYATKYAWQKNFGYTRVYDVLAPFFRMCIDTERIKFKYNNKSWLISFWKGEYGITTGGEIGIYNTSDLYPNKNTLYHAIENHEMLDMHFKLYHKNEMIIDIKDHHWWLAAFKLGMHSKPKDLKMAISIKFPNEEMLEAFLKSFKKLGYKDKDFSVNNLTFSFCYKHPKTHKVWTRFWLMDNIILHLNKRNVKLYNKYVRDFIDVDGPNKIEDLIPDALKESNLYLNKLVLTSGNIR